MNSDQVEFMNMFIDKHISTCHILNVDFTLTFKSVGGIGMVIKMKCNKCGEEIDLTDTESW